MHKNQLVRRILVARMRSRARRQHEADGADSVDQALDLRDEERWLRAA
jgi:hypothetical protein